MARFTQLLISGNFAIGATHYEDIYPGEEQSAHVVLTVGVEDGLAIQAIVDTGAPWCILDPGLVGPPGEVPAGYEPERRLLIRGTWYNGRLLRMRIGLQAENGGDDLEIDATVFVPALPPGDLWPHPNFIGLDGFLNRIRFAVDPGENAFYFGPV